MTGICRAVYLIIIIMMLPPLATLSAQDSSGSQVNEDQISFEWQRLPGDKYSSPDPFTLDARAAQTCINLLRTVGFVLWQDNTDPSQIIKVQTVWAEFRELHKDWPSGFRRHYDIILNGNSIDWPNTSLEYGGEMINLQILFTYQNQEPAEALEYRRRF